MKLSELRWEPDEYDSGNTYLRAELPFGEVFEGVSGAPSIVGKYFIRVEDVSLRQHFPYNAGHWVYLDAMSAQCLILELLGRLEGNNAAG